MELRLLEKLKYCKNNDGDLVTVRSFHTFLDDSCEKQGDR